MDRRTFTRTLAGGLLISPLAVRAQQARVYRVGVVLLGARIRKPSMGSGRVSQNSASRRGNNSSSTCAMGKVI